MLLLWKEQAGRLSAAALRPELRRDDVAFCGMSFPFFAGEQSCRAAVHCAAIQRRYVREGGGLELRFVKLKPMMRGFHSKFNLLFGIICIQFII